MRCSCPAMMPPGSPFDAYYYDQVTGEQKNITEAGKWRPRVLAAAAACSIQAGLMPSVAVAA